MNERFSLIIPTMWKSPLLLQMLPVYQQSAWVAEIIIIDNDPDNAPEHNFSNYTKLRFLTRDRNIYVNPAWNWGASLAQHTIVLVNDDILIKDLDELFIGIVSTNYDIIGARINDKFLEQNQDSPVINDAPSRFPANSYGCFMVVRKYHYIPEQLRIHAGDNHLFNSVKSRGIISTGRFIHTTPSVTIKSEQGFTSISADDRRMYSIMRNESRFNIIIRTSNRPNYFSQCIKSIRLYAPHALLHVTVDNEPDLEYVARSCKGMNWRYYLINREVIANFCQKKEIARRPFIYNHYINVVRPFLEGWCMILDDDDQLVSRPGYLNDTRHITLHKVNVGDRVVPPSYLFGQPPVLNNVSALGIIFHSSQMVDWNPQRGGDFDFISNLYSRYKAIWINRVIAASQTGGNFGKRNDISAVPKITATI